MMEILDVEPYFSYHWGVVDCFEQELLDPQAYGALSYSLPY